MDDKRFRELIEKWRKEADPPYTDTIPLSSPAMARCIALIQCAKQLESALADESGEKGGAMQPGELPVQCQQDPGAPGAEQSETKVEAPPVNCPKCGWLLRQSPHGPYCPRSFCKYRWQTELDGSTLKAPPASQPDEFDELAEKLDRELIVSEDSVSSHSRCLIAAELRRVAAEEAEWWHKRCCERVEVIGQPGVFQCFGCERIAALEHAGKGEK